MANVGTRASNASGIVGKWFPYYYKPFYLGNATDGVGSTDGAKYISQTTGTSALLVEGSCTHSYNCNFYYELVIVTDSSDFFYIKKYDLSGTLIDTIYASTTSGDGRYWSDAGVGSYTIDAGVNITIPHTTNFDNGDVYKITLPTYEEMERRKIYHGGFSTFMQLAETEGKAYHSEIIPKNLKGKGISLIWNPPNPCGALETVPLPGQATGLMGCMSREDEGGNKACSIFLEWNSDRDGVTDSTAGNATDGYGWSANETWALGTAFLNDIDINDSDDSPAYSHAPQNDTEPPVLNTGQLQVINVTTSGRAGYARLKSTYEYGIGSPIIHAHNQYIPVIIMLS